MSDVLQAFREISPADGGWRDKGVYFWAEKEAVIAVGGMID